MAFWHQWRPQWQWRKRLSHTMAHMVIFLLKVLGRASDANRIRIAKVLSIAGCALARRRMLIAQTNLTLCFPELTEEQIKPILKSQMRYFVQAAVDRGMIWFAPLDQLRRSTTIVDGHYYEDAHQTGQPIILLAPHFVGLDVGGLRLSLDEPMVSMYQRQSNPVFDQLLLQGRNRSGVSKVFERREGVRKLVKYLRSFYPLYYLPDMDFGIKDSLFASFFGQPAATLTSLPKLAKMTDAVVLPCVTRIDTVALAQGQTKYIIQFYPPWSDYANSTDELAQTEAMNRFIEERIKEDIPQYLWMHKRFKTRPPGQSSVYPS